MTRVNLPSKYLVALAVLVVCGCGLQVQERSAFLALTETFGFSAADEEDQDGAGGGSAAEERFRLDSTVTFVNTHPTADLNVLFLAWVNVSSIRSAEQQDALLADGYVQLSSTVRIGSVFALPPGTFVRNGPGAAGATIVRLGPEGDGTLPSSESFTMITPDVVLALADPPVSCESKAFIFTEDRRPLDAQFVPGGLGFIFVGSTGAGGIKTLAQVDVYDCDPLHPGLFLKLTGGVAEPNEYFEGQDITFTFNAVPDADGKFANVLIE